MDGCSMGKESQFASLLITKLLRKIGKEIRYREFSERRKRSAEECLESIMNALFKELGQIKNQLHLEIEELLSTIVLGILDLTKNEIELIIIGDGLICKDGIIYEYEQDNQPDYLGYHLNEPFKNWYSEQSQKLSLNNIKDISISTDGIFSFRNFDGKEIQQIQEREIIEYLLIDESLSNHENMLFRKITDLENYYGLLPGDDLTIIRIKIE